MNKPEYIELDNKETKKVIIDVQPIVFAIIYLLGMIVGFQLEKWYEIIIYFVLYIVLMMVTKIIFKKYIENN